MAEESNTARGFVLGFIGGAAIGAILALLYAPKSGRELRAELREKADDFLEDAEEHVQAAKTKASAIVSEARKRSETLVTDARKTAKSLIEDADKVLSGARQKTETVIQEGVKLKDAVRAGVDAYKAEKNRT